MTHSLPLYPSGAPRTCTCEVEFDTETGEIKLPNFDECVFVMEAHGIAIARALEQAKDVIDEVKKEAKG